MARSPLWVVWAVIFAALPGVADTSFASRSGTVEETLASVPLPADNGAEKVLRFKVFKKLYTINGVTTELPSVDQTIEVKGDGRTFYLAQSGVQTGFLLSSEEPIVEWNNPDGVPVPGRRGTRTTAVGMIEQVCYTPHALMLITPGATTMSVTTIFALAE